MKKLLLGLAFVSTLAGLAACNGSDPVDPVDPGDGYEVLKGDITSDMTLSASKKYKLEGFVYVKDGATLTIEPGTVIVGDKATKATLIITRTGMINATGTSEKPIVFTSQYDPGIRNAGDWGGIVLLGKASVNSETGDAKIEGGALPTDPSKEKDYIWYGGTEDGHSSGTLKYVRIEFAGIAFSVDNEINALTMGGVGSGTTISHVQVYRSGDDAFEWFGGTVNCDHLIATYSVDDDFDTDFGFSGKVQFGVVQRAKTIADVSGSNGFESDNNANGTAATPQTAAIFSNMTIAGPFQGSTFSGASANYQNGAQIRRNSSLSIHNSIFLGYPVGLYIDNTKGEPTSANILANKLKYANNIIAGCATPLKASAPFSIEDMQAWFDDNDNSILASTDDAKLKDPYKFSSTVSTSVGRPDFRLAAGSPALTGASFSGLTGFTPTTYRGAFDGTTDWTQGWAEWDADSKTY